MSFWNNPVNKKKESNFWNFEDKDWLPKQDRVDKKEVIVLQLPKQEKVKKFRIQHNSLMLTYTKVGFNCALDKDWLLAQLKAICANFKNIVISDHLIAHEKHEDGRYHTHVLIRFADDMKLDSTNPRLFDLHDVHPNILPVIKSLWEAKWNYLCKEDNKDKLIETNKAVKVWSSKTMQDALKFNVAKFNDVAGIEKLYKNKPRAVVTRGIISSKDFYPWQIKLANELSTVPGGRKVVWYIDEKGGGGKSAFYRSLASEKPDDVAWMRYVNSKDGATVISNELDRGWNQQVLFFDLPRTIEHFEGGGLYTLIECILDGMVTVSKYDSKSVTFNPPHVVVFANWAPNTKLLSTDRWDIRTVPSKSLEEASNIKASSESVSEVLMNCANIKG